MERIGAILAWDRIQGSRAIRHAKVFLGDPRQCTAKAEDYMNEHLRTKEFTNINFTENNYWPAPNDPELIEVVE